MFDRIIDESNPRYRGPLPKPRRTPTSAARDRRGSGPGAGRRTTQLYG